MEEDINMNKIDSKISEFRLQMQHEKFERNRKRNLEGNLYKLTYHFKMPNIVTVKRRKYVYIS